MAPETILTERNQQRIPEAQQRSLSAVASAKAEGLHCVLTYLLTLRFQL
jgi:hypothetical protein